MPDLSHAASAPYHFEAPAIIAPPQVSAGWLWQTDSRYRITHLFGDPIARSALGKRPWEVAGVDTHHEGWRLLFDSMIARKPFQNACWRRRDALGRIHECVISGEPVFGPKGRFVGYRGVGRDLGDAGGFTP